MKKTILFLITVFLTLDLSAQVPQAFNYQAIAKRKNGSPVVMQDISVRITISEGEYGTMWFQETHQTRTGLIGLFNIRIGKGNVQAGSFTDIPWDTGNKYMEVAIDPKGRNNYTYMGSVELLSVPFALYGEDADADPENELQELILEENLLSLTDGNTIELPEDADVDPTNEIQDITLDGSQLTIDQGSTVDLATAFEFTSTDDQTLALEGANLSIEDGNTLDLSPIDTDNQKLNFEENILSIENANSVDLSSLKEIDDGAVTSPKLADEAVTPGKIAENAVGSSHIGNSAIATRHISDGSIIAGKLAENSVITTNIMDESILTEKLADGAVTPEKLSPDVDADPTNELQVLTISNDTIYLSDGGFVKLPGGLSYEGDYYYADRDQDGFGDYFSPVFVPAGANSPPFFIIDMMDCDDEDPEINPDADEIYGDGVDNDCDGIADEFASDPAVDDDGDGFTENEGDCNDNDASIYPGAAEILDDGIDQNCDGITDIQYWDVILINDGGNKLGCIAVVRAITGLSLADAKALVESAPVAVVEAVLLEDAENIKTALEEAGAEVELVITQKVDIDNDGDGVAAKDGDCDDFDANVYPGAPEIPEDGIDQDCDGYDAGNFSVILLSYTSKTVMANVIADIMGISVGSAAGLLDGLPLTVEEDISQAEAEALITYLESAGGAANALQTALVDDDGDGHYSIASGGDDCDDTNADINPGMTEIADGIDNNCDGNVDEGFGGTPPESFDWRTALPGSISPIKNQGSCGNCWIFSTLGMIEARANIDAYRAGDPMPQYDLSEQYVMACHSTSYTWCSGGSPISVLNFVQNNGVVFESCYNYNPVSPSSSCPTTCPDSSDPMDKLRIDDYIMMSNPSLEEMKEEIYNHGPIVIHLNVYQDFYSYINGIYTYDGTSPSVGATARTIVGWGREGGVDYWIIKFDWGAGFGEQGYVRIAMNSSNINYGYVYKTIGGSYIEPEL